MANVKVYSNLKDSLKFFVPENGTFKEITIKGHGDDLSLNGENYTEMTDNEWQVISQNYKENANIQTGRIYLKTDETKPLQKVQTLNNITTKSNDLTNSK